ncbi:SDR family NAD(P)-dependent oxidoreductase [Amylibacter sp.]|jgi:NAD(P)-dependent dehydrogenase (short-subunit alcohol dehydrogenase family)|nr:SDR family NAD(P)-dependent oxidoreductase [Amylibacter sp.]MDB9857860.1 SDR family NAD(P)-dependent oxidoreductase [Amylibacter sp.]
MPDLSNKSAIVTGGASGLGAAVAAHLAGRGAKVCLFDMNADAATATAAKLGATWQQVDVSDPDSVKTAFEKARATQGQERILVNCAGIGPASKTVSRGEPHDPLLFAKVIGVNLLGSFYCASMAAAGMVNEDPAMPDGERGVVVNTASVAAYEGQVGQVAYAASKGGVVGMTLPMARDLADKGVRIATIAPGLFKTPLLEGLPQEVQDSLGAQVPFPSRLGNPAEFGALVGHIIDNPMINGEVIRLDGAIRMAPR